jgi:chromosome segregation ATPase
MPSKSELQTLLKEQHGINKNITQSLSLEDCENLLILLNNQSSVGRLVDAFIEKNSELSQNNRHYGQQRSQAMKKLEELQAEYEQLEKSIADQEKANAALDQRKNVLSNEQEALEAEIKKLTSENQSLGVKVQTLTTRNDQLIEANDQLKRDNKELKNVVDQIRLRLAKDTKLLLQYEDSEIRKALIRLFRWTLG